MRLLALLRYNVVTSFELWTYAVSVASFLSFFFFSFLCYGLETKRLKKTLGTV